MTITFCCGFSLCTIGKCRLIKPSLFWPRFKASAYFDEKFQKEFEDKILLSRIVKEKGEICGELLLSKCPSSSRVRF